MRTGDPQLHYESIESRARPARVAVLTDCSDTAWRHTSLRIIEALSSVWGGKHSVIVPTDGVTIEPVFWSILEKFSPDYVYFYRKTGADIQISCPEEYSACLQRAIVGYDDEITRQHINENLQEAYVGRFALDTNLCSQIADRLVPFHFQKYFEPLTGHGYVPHQLTKIVDVLPYVDHPQSFSTIEVAAEVDPIWWAGRTGTNCASFSQQLRNAGLNEETNRVTVEDFSDFARWIAGSEVSSARRTLAKTLDGGLKFVPPDQMRPTPFDLSMSRIALYGSALSDRDVAGRFAFVLGDSLADFCLSYCLPRVGYPAVWIPFTWLEELEATKSASLRSVILSVIYSVPVVARHGSGFKMCSISKDASSINEALEVLRKHTGVGLNDEQLASVEAISLVAAAADLLIPYCIDTPNHSDIYPFLGDRSVGTVRSPRPTGFSKLNATKHRWVAEVITRSKPVPTVSYIAEALIIRPQSAGAVDARVSKNALAYVCPGSFLIIGEDINANLQDPEIKLFDTFTAVSLIAKANGLACQLSDKGIYQRDSIEKLGGVSEVANLLKEHGSRAVLLKFLDHTGREKGIYDEGCVLNAEKRTYLDLAAVQKLLAGSEDAAVSLLDRLTAAKVIYRGFVLGCAVCKHAEWYSLAALADEFQCRRCGREQTIGRQHWRHPASPQIFYKLDEIVYQFLKNDSDIVALSLDYMSQRSQHRFDYSTELEFRNSHSEPIGEVDFCAVWNGLLTIGEAKKNGELASSDSETRKIVNKYAYLADMLNARQVCFCTTSPEWKSSSVETVQRAFQGKLAVPMFLAAGQLLGTSST